MIFRLIYFMMANVPPVNHPVSCAVVSGAVVSGAVVSGVSGVSGAVVMVELFDRVHNENIELKARVTRLETHIEQLEAQSDTMVTQLNEWKRWALNAERECTVQSVRAARSSVS